MFPIICLSSQEVAINQYIAKHNLSKKQILLWIAFYGELVFPDEESALRHRPPIFGISTDVTQSVNAYIFKSSFGLLNIFKFLKPGNQIQVRRSMDDFWQEALR